MAIVTFHDGLGPNASISAQFDWASTMLIGGPTSATLSDPSGMAFSFQGSDFSYSPGSPSWWLFSGTITSLILRDASNAILFEVSDIATNGPWLYNWIVAGNDLVSDVDGAPGRLWGTDNTVNGSGLADTLLTGAGDDLVFGGGGRDRLESTGGDDTFTGGARADDFVAPVEGSLVITDFNDTLRPVFRDEIVMDRWVYRHMTDAQVGADTVLTLHHQRGAPDTVLTLQNYDLANLDRSDFLLFD